MTSAPKEKSTKNPRRLTPMLQQYVAAKEQHPEALLLFRMGDFYELFFDDARTAAQELGLTLTARDKGPDAVPMAGVPHHAVSGYIAKLIQRGFTVAICDQVEDPKTAKGLVRREITRLITPGTVADMDALEPSVANYLAHIYAYSASMYGLCFVDLLAGELLCCVAPESAVLDELRRMGVREVLLEPDVAETFNHDLTSVEISTRVLAEALPTPNKQHQILHQRLGEKALCNVPPEHIQTCLPGLVRLIEFADMTQKRAVKHWVAPQFYTIHDSLRIDAATRRNLELLATQVGARRQGTLLAHLDRTCSAMGARLLRHWMLFPLRDIERINRRFDTVAQLLKKRQIRQSLQEQLGLVRDIERLVGRVSLGRATPRDLGLLRDSLQALPLLAQDLMKLAGPLAEHWQNIDLLDELSADLSQALIETPPLHANEGGIFRTGYDADLDVLIQLAEQGHEFLNQYEKRERQRTGIGNLRVRYNRVFGYYIEVTKAHLLQVPEDFMRKQTLVNAERFITEELKEFEVQVLQASERRKGAESQLFAQMVHKVAAQTQNLRAIARLLAQTDVLCSLADVADTYRYVRPEMVDNIQLDLVESRHPVLAAMLQGGEQFVPNDIHLTTDERQIMLITGPNMAGKSTVMRQVALTALMAHMGSFVPASKATIGLFDRIFTRVGAADDLTRGQSTFMVEMLETATILNEATQRSLVILDEIGRGTSTYDGMSIAGAVLEELHSRIQCLTLFATHFHELTHLSEQLERLCNVSVRVQEANGVMVFLRTLVEAPASGSYGIEVARLAGIPEHVLRRARCWLENFEMNEHVEVNVPAPSTQQRCVDADHWSSQLTLMARELATIDVNHSTPFQALATLERLQALLPDDLNAVTGADLT